MAAPSTAATSIGPELTDEGTDDDRVSVRPLQRSDAAEIAAMNTRNRADIERVSPPQPASAFTAAGQTERIEEILKQCKLCTRAYWTIRVDGDIAGDISLHAIQRSPVQDANVGYMVDAAFRGRGVATTALRLVVRSAFGELHLNRLEAGAMPSNRASQRVLEKAEFTRVGVLRRHLFIGDTWQDHVLYEILGPDFIPAMWS